tara:strand:- start:43 stop:249 length:207 start_codon:yes stop_codon:yes gene_type:complete
VQHITLVVVAAEKELWDAKEQLVHVEQVAQVELQVEVQDQLIVVVAVVAEDLLLQVEQVDQELLLQKN